ncbi:Integrase core domain protein [Rosistilla oblonga]|nr:integrase core domain-containing protein [Rosistilla oblonga]QDV11313.1 Integrase core domain protein [Rosistilla oblonga]
MRITLTTAIMFGELFGGRQIRLLTIVDHFTRESRAIEGGQRMRRNDAITVLKGLARNRKLPKWIRVDSGPEFPSIALDQSAYANGVVLDFSTPGKPTDYPFIESFNGSVLAECLNGNSFLALDDAIEKIEAWRVDYNKHRPPQRFGQPGPQRFRFIWPGGPIKVTP